MPKHMAPGEGGGIAAFIQKVAVTIGSIVALACVAVIAQSLYLHRNPLQTVMGDWPVQTPQALFHRDRIALLMLGIDYNYDASDNEFSTNARSDTIKTVALNFPTASNPNGSISILSVPRDMGVVMADGHEDKINAAYTGFGKDSAAAAHNSEKVIANFLGMPGFDRYITLRIDATKDLIDAIGGIDVVPDETMNYDDTWGHLHIHFIGGKKVHMDGNQAVSYSRFRHDACSDPCRIKRQDQVIRITMAKLKNDRFNDLVHITQLIDVVRRNVYTDLSDQEMISLAWAFQHVDPSKLQTQQVPYVAVKETNCCGELLVADDAAKATLVAQTFPPQPMASADPQAVAAIDPSTIHVDVQNGSGISGQGARLAALLRKKGYLVEGVSNADSFAYDATQIRVHSLATPLAGESIRQALAIKTATVKPDAPRAAGTPPSDVTVIVGRDYANLAGPQGSTTVR